MGNSSKPRKKHRPKVASIMGGLRAISDQQYNANPLPAERQTNVKIAYHTSIDAMACGYAEETHFDSIVYALNISAILAENGIGEEYLETIKPALLGMGRCRTRWEQTGKFRLDGDAMNAVKEAFAIHEAHLEYATQGELESAIVEMDRRVVMQKIEYREAA